jgi:hypothetical protein
MLWLELLLRGRTNSRSALQLSVQADACIMKADTQARSLLLSPVEYMQVCIPALDFQII